MRHCVFAFQPSEEYLHSLALDVNSPRADHNERNFISYGL